MNAISRPSSPEAPRLIILEATKQGIRITGIADRRYLIDTRKALDEEIERRGQCG